MAATTPGEVLEFWFGAPAADAQPQQAREQWFSKDEAFDAEIRTRFGEAIGEALAGRLEHWLDTPEGALAYLLLLDQFTRNAYRGTPASFAGDARALAAARRLVALGWDRGFAPVRRWFCYLPFEHSESLADQRESLRLFATLRDDPVAGGAYDWAVKHFEIVERFGRFPHRNEILGRASTAEEIEFLRQPGSRF